MAGLGHFGFGFAAKRFAPKLPLAVLLVASETIDLVYLILLLIGIDGSGAGYWTHSLFMAAIWAFLAGLSAFLFGRNARWALVTGFVVFSHWVLDFVVWPMTSIFPDAVGIPLFFEGSPRVGLGLYRWTVPTIIGEAFFLLGGVAVYVFARKKTSFTDRSILPKRDR